MRINQICSNMFSETTERILLGVSLGLSNRLLQKYLGNIVIRHFDPLPPPPAHGLGHPLCFATSLGKEEMSLTEQSSC